MRNFRLHEPDTLARALTVLSEHGLDARPVAGGTDLVAGIMRDEIVGSAMPYPTDLVDLTQIPELRGIRPEAGGIRIGAATTLVELVESDEVRRRWPLLAAAAGDVAGPEIRATGTLGGNLNQRPRCWFFRGRDFDCIKKGGTICYAVKGDNRYNAILGGNICFIVHPSDVAPALIALGAEARIASPAGERSIALGDYFVSPTQNLVAETVLQPDEVLVEVRVPEPAKGSRQVWRKVNEKGRSTWDFALASVAAVAETADGAWVDGRVVLGGVAPVPYRALVVEQALQGRAIREAVPDAVAALRAEARPMRDNAYKLEITAVLLEEALLALVDEDAA